MNDEWGSKPALIKIKCLVKYIQPFPLSIV